ncbi:hypothetical protein PTKIN_Ptkin18bG0024500 [Pterospermum kingtungense]
MMQHQAGHIITRGSKNILRLTQWRHDLRRQKLQTVFGKSHKIIGSDYEKSSRDSLLTCRELSDGSSRGSKYVPKGFIAVYVGPELRRFVIPMSYLAMPEFRALMDQVAEEFGFEHEGGLEFPCDQQEFEEILLRCGARPNV